MRLVYFIKIVENFWLFILLDDESAMLRSGESVWFIPFTREVRRFLSFSHSTTHAIHTEQSYIHTKPTDVMYSKTIFLVWMNGNTKQYEEILILLLHT